MKSACKYVPIRGDVVLHERQGKPLLKVMGIKYTKDIRKQIYRVILHEDDTVTIIYRDKTWMWIWLIVFLFAAYVGINADYITKKTVDKFFTYLYKPYEHTESVNCGYLLINQGRPGITFENADASGVEFGYEIYVDDIFFEKNERTWNGNGEYELILFGKIPQGKHQLLALTYCYAPGKTEPFDVMEKEIIIFVE